MIEPSVKISADVFNTILSNRNLTRDQIVTMLKKTAALSRKIEKLIETKDFDNPLFDADKERVYIECRSAYPERTWDKLTEEAKKDLKAAYFYAAYGEWLEDDEATPIYKMCKCVECEIKNRLIQPFAAAIRFENIQITGNETDRKMRYDLSNPSHIRAALGEMLVLIKEASNNRTQSNYAKRFDLFVHDPTNGWSAIGLYSARVENFFLDYPKKFRNDGAHDRIYDPAKTAACKERTRAVLVWLMDAKMATMIAEA